MTKLFIMILTFLAGIASSTQGLYNGYWKESIDLKTVLLLNSLVVFALVVFFYIITADDGFNFSLEKMSPSILIGGLCGFFVIMVFAIAFPAIGATSTSLLFISGLLIASLFYDHTAALNLTLKSISLQKVFGILLVVLGSYITLRSPT
ncbi:MAG: DMT family transporter [Campylobacterota bacterium]|nr:DMT family transporter [Campylobacterota bacterium]